MKEFTNTFDGGLNMNSESKLVQGNQYIDAQNIEVNADGYVNSVTQMKGTVLTGTITPPTNGAAKVAGGVATKVKTDNGFVDGIVGFYYRLDLSLNLIFEIKVVTLGDYTSEIQVEDVVEELTESYRQIDEVFLLYRKNLGPYNASTDYNSSFGSEIIAIPFQEQNIPVVYFTDQSTPLKKIVIDISSETNAPYEDREIFAVANDIAPPPIVEVKLSSDFNDNYYNRSSENIYSGSYFVSCRFLNSKTNSYTKWSLINGPVVTSNTTIDGTARINNGKIGRSDKQLLIKVNVDGMTQEEQSSYDRVQYAVIEKIDGDGTTSGNAKITEPITFDPNNIEGSYYYYSNSSFEEEVDIGEIVVDDAQIKSCKSFVIKNGRIIQGGLEYADLEFDNGEVIAGDATVEKHNLYFTNSEFNYFNEVYTPNQLFRGGFFRDEVYRFGITYHDEYGNWSPVQVLDFSGFSDNNADTGCVDFKFPSLKEESLFRSIGPKAKSLYLRIHDISNHPSWARGFAIVRAKRIKNIAFQTPVIPTRLVSSPFASISYPQNGTPDPDSDAQIGNVLGTLIPKDMSNVFPVDFVHFTNLSAQYLGTRAYFDQVDKSYVSPSDSTRTIVSGSNSSVYVNQIFPPNNIYNYNNTLYEPYVHEDGDKIKGVDVAYITASYDNLGSYSSSYVIGSDVDATDSFAWAENPKARYYYEGNSNDADLGGGLIPDGFNPNPLREYQDVINGQSKITLLVAPSTLESSTFGDYEGIESTIKEGYTPINQKCGVVVTEHPWKDLLFQFQSSGSFTLNGVSIDTGTRVTDVDNNPITGTWQNYDQASSIGRMGAARGENALMIANVEKGLSDFRYGDRNSYHEFVSGGFLSYFRFPSTNYQDPVTVDVHNGDCFISMHTFKTSDSSYVAAGNDNDADPTGTITISQSEAERKYGNSFRDFTVEFNRPIPQRVKSQTISVFLESEIDANKYLTVEHSNYESISIGTGGLLLNAIIPKPSGSGEGKNQISYTYNLGYNLPNNFKVFIPNLKDFNDNTLFLSRLSYSDPVIYNSRENGVSRFRVANTLDLNESYGSVNSLNIVRDQLIAFQNSAITYIPADSNILEQADSDTLLVRTDDFLGTPLSISVNNGCQHPRSIASDGYGLFFFDKRNKNISYYSPSEGIIDLSDSGMRNFFNQRFSDDELVDSEQTAVYDFINDRYIFLSGAGVDLPSGDSYGVFGAMWSKKMKAWETLIYFGGSNSSSSYVGPNRVSPIYTDNGVFYLADSELYQGGLSKNSNFLNIDQDPYIVLSVNPDILDSKVFDVININSQFPPSKVEVYEDLVINSFSPRGLDLLNFASMEDEIYEREGTYRIPIKRLSTGRVRGQVCYLKIYFNKYMYGSDNGELSFDLNQRVGMISATTNYRTSERSR